MDFLGSKRFYHIALLLTSGVGYLEWADNKTILFAAELELITKIADKATAFIHPAVAMPFLGQLILLYSAITNPSKLWPTWIAIVCIGLLHILILSGGMTSGNFLMIASVLPFMILSFLFLRNRNKLS